MRLRDRVAIITGGASGIGRETCLLFAREGARVVIADFDTVAGQAVEAEIRELGGAGYFQRVDVTDKNATQAMVDNTVALFGKADILINNAGIIKDNMLTKLSTEDWDQVIAVNLTGVFNCTQAVVPVMVAQGYGRIVNCSSVVGLYGNFGQTNYAATKAGVIGMTKSWAKTMIKTPNNQEFDAESLVGLNL